MAVDPLARPGRQLRRRARGQPRERRGARGEPPALPRTSSPPGPGRSACGSATSTTSATRPRLPAADLIVAADGVNSQLRAASAEFGTHGHRGAEQVHLARHRQAVRLVQLLLRADGGRLDLGLRLPARAEDEHVHRRMRAADVGGARLRQLLADPYARPPRGDLLRAPARQRLWSEFADGKDARWLNFRRSATGAGTTATWCSSATARTPRTSPPGLAARWRSSDAIALAAQLRRAGYRAAGDGAAGLTAVLAAYQRQRQAELRRHLAEAQRSAAWFENVPRLRGAAAAPVRHGAARAQRAAAAGAVAAAVRSAARRPQAARHRGRAPLPGRPVGAQAR